MIKSFQIAILHLALTSRPESKQRFELDKLLARKTAELLALDDQRKAKAVEMVEGWACGWPNFRFDDILVDVYTSLNDLERNWDQNRELPQLWQQFKIYDNIISVRNC